MAVFERPALTRVVGFYHPVINRSRDLSRAPYPGRPVRNGEQTINKLHRASRHPELREAGLLYKAP